MKLQNYEKKNAVIREKFQALKKARKLGKARLNLSWSNWGFGLESLADSARAWPRRTSAISSCTGTTMERTSAIIPGKP